MYRHLLFILCLLLSLELFANDATKVVYGEDDVFDSTLIKNEMIASLSRSVAARILNFNLVWDGDFYDTDAYVDTVGETLHLCSDERYFHDLSLASCTGFLVSEDIMMTAGHCVRLFNCRDYFWAFDYTSNMSTPDGNYRLQAKDVYSCAGVLESVEILYDKENGKKIDYAFFKLDRPVKGRQPLKLNFKDDLKVGTEVFTIGYPLGTAQKVQTGGKVIDNSNSVYFSATLDTFQGNSGGPVFNSETFKIEGIIVRGKRDTYFSVPDDIHSCQRINHCDDQGQNCNYDTHHLAEEVTKSSFIEATFNEIVLPKL